MLFRSGTSVAGVGFGLAYLGAFRAIVGSAPADGRAGVVAAILIVTYASFGALSLAAGFATTAYGLRTTSLGYLAVVVTIAAVAVGLVVRERCSPETERARHEAARRLPAGPCARAHVAFH